jgi:negative regulator of flagellin synthesis FlgM
MLNAIEDIIMVNKINDMSNSKPIDSDTRLKAKNNETKADSTENQHAIEQDSVNLSSVSKQLEILKASLKDIPEINAARVAYFKNEIQSGNYKINSDKIALKMLNNVETA